jgi:hypothetical protein
MKTCCAWVAGRPGNPHKSVAPLVLSLKQSCFVDISDSFCDLQEARHEADYNHLATFSKAATVALVSDARASIEQVATATLQERHAFFSLLALRARPL